MTILLAKDFDRMILTKFITKQCIVPDMKVSTKADALKELTHLLFEKRKLEGVSSALEQIVAREVNESTGIGRGIAVPHARVTSMKSLACAVARIPQGLDFKAVDRKPTQLIFLICYPPVDQTTYLNFVATVARLLSDKAHLQAMLDAATAEDMFEALESMSESFTETHEEHVKKLRADPAIAKAGDGNTNLLLLARLQLCHEMLQTNKSGKSQITKRIEAIRSLLEPRILTHFDKLSKSRHPALVSVEGDTCQGCFMKLPSKFVQQVRQDPAHIHTCLNCSRFIYVV